MQSRFKRVHLWSVSVLCLAAGVAVAQEFTCYERDENELQTQIVGSVESFTGNQLPWMVNLSFGGTPFCGGSLVNENTVVTAAHCVRPDMTVRRAADDGAPYGDALKVRNYIIHPEYDASTNVSASDIAVLKLDGSFDVAQAGLPFLLSPSQAANWGKPDDCAFAAGWGATAQGGNVSDILLGADLPIWSDSVCQESYGDSLFEGTICAGYKEGEVGSCQGDSGGPLIVRGGPTGFIQIGVVSFGRGCAQPNFPTVYTRTASFYDWIFDAAESLPNQ